MTAFKLWFYSKMLWMAEYELAIYKSIGAGLDTVAVARSNVTTLKGIVDSLEVQYG